jgi:hypothetical protein
MQKSERNVITLYTFQGDMVGSGFKWEKKNVFWLDGEWGA